MITFVLKAVMALGYLVYLGGPAEALRVWSGLGAMPEPPACFSGAPECGPDLPGDVRLAMQSGTGLSASLEGGALLRPALMEQEQGESAAAGRGGPLLLEVNGQEATE